MKNSPDSFKISASSPVENFCTDDSQRVRQHFHQHAEAFDSIYSGHKSALGRWLDRRLRGDMQKRLRLTLEACQPIKGRRVLDVGCGTGRFCFPLSKMGAARVVGIDFAQNMIERAKVLARENGLEDACEFILADVQEYHPPDPFDYVLAIGLFDYVRDDRWLLTQLRRLTKGKAVMTFPRADTWRAPLRRARLGVMGCPVFFYNEKQIRDHLLISGFDIKTLQRVGKLFFVEAT